MLEKIRKPESTRSRFTYITSLILFSMIIATFIFMIPGMSGTGGAVNAAAEVGSSTVSLREYDDQLRAMRSQYQKMFNGEIPPVFEANIKNQVLESLIQAEVMTQFAKEQNIVVSNLEVADFLRTEIPAFQEDGRFSLSLYNNYLDAVRLTPSSFEKRVYSDILRQKIQGAFSVAFNKTQTEKQLLSEAKAVKLRLKYIKLNTDLFDSQSEVSDVDATEFLKGSNNLTELKSFFDSNKANYKEDFESLKADIAKDFLKDKASKLKDQELKDINKARDAKSLKEFLLKTGHIWSEEQKLSLTDTNLNNVGETKDFFTGVLDLNKGQSSNKLITVGTDRFVFLNEGFTTETAKSEVPEPRVGSRGQDAYNLVYQDEKKNKSVIINNELVAN